MSRIFKRAICTTLYDEAGATSGSWNRNLSYGCRYYNQAFGYWGNEWMTKAFARRAFNSLSWADIARRLGGRW